MPDKIIQLKHIEENTVNISLGKYKFPKSVRRESEEDTKLVKAQNGTGLPAIILFIPCCCESSRHETMIKRKKKKGISIRERKKKNIIFADNMTFYLENSKEATENSQKLL